MSYTEYKSGLTSAKVLEQQGIAHPLRTPIRREAKEAIIMEDLRAEHQEYYQIIENDGR